MSGSTTHALPDAIREAARPLTSVVQSYDPVVGLVGDARFTLLARRPTARTSSTRRARRSPSD